jgi:hypothetical protein
VGARNASAPKSACTVALVALVTLTVVHDEAEAELLVNRDDVAQARELLAQV